MGLIFDYFGHLTFHNEAEVSQNFLIPLLTEFLEYRLDEILPEHLIPAFVIQQNRNKSVSTSVLEPRARPDYVVTLNNTTWAFLCDSKAPDEALDLHLAQLRAYCIASKTNLLLITNGRELQVYFANSLVFLSKNIGELDQRFSELTKLLGRAHAVKSDLERLQSLNLTISLSGDPKLVEAQHYREVAIANSDFTAYLQGIIEIGDTLELPETVKEAFNFDIQRFPAEKLYILQDVEMESGIFRQKANIPYSTVINDANPPTPLIIVGESGIGKTNLLRQSLSNQASFCLDYQSTRIPVLVKLGIYTRAQSLFNLVHQVLLSRGAVLDINHLTQLFIQGRVLLLLDAFDEVFDEYIADIEREIQSLLDLYPKCRVIITTRHFRVPLMQLARRYQLSSLSGGQIADFSRFYLHNEMQNFLDQLIQKHLYRTASNTLLLTLLILLYHSRGALPPNRGQILRAVVSGVRTRDERKSRRFNTQLGWELREKLLSRLAFKALSQGESYALDQQSVEAVLLEALDELEKTRQISPGLTVHDVTEMLAATGFVSNMGNGIVFWHRSFLEYFAAPELLRQCRRNPEIIRQLIQKTAWEDIFPLVTLNSDFSLDIVREVYEFNVFLAARLLIEAGIFEGDEYRKVGDGLYERCSSSLVSIRQIAINLLQRMEGEHINALILRLIDSEYNDIQIPILVEIARRKLPQARAIVFSRLDWSVPHELRILGTSVTAVIEALSEFDDEEAHLQIIAFWRKNPDMWTDFACREGLIALAKRNILTKRTKQEILEFFLTDFDDSSNGHKYWSLGDVIITLGNQDFAPLLISKLIEVSEDQFSSRGQKITEILASFNDDEVANLLIAHVNADRLSIHTRRRFACALSESKTSISIELFETFAKDKDSEIRSCGLRRLGGQLPFDKIRTLVLDALHPPPNGPEHFVDSKFHLVQQVAFEILAQNGQMELLMQPEHCPQYYFEDALETMYKTISEQNLHSLLRLVRQLGKQNPGTRIAIWSAWLLADFGHIEEAKSIVETSMEQGQDSRVTSAILEGIHRFPTDYALQIIDSYMTDSADTHTRHVCIEALGNIGSQAACDRLALLAWTAAESNDGAKNVYVENALRAMENFAPRDKEDWLLNLLDKLRLDRFALRRAIELLGLIGGAKSLDALEKYLFNQPIYIQDTAFWAIQHIHRRQGRVWFHGEEVPVIDD